MIGEDISLILEKIEVLLWSHEIYEKTRPEYPIEGFRAATKIFMSVILDKMWELQEKENMTMENRKKMAEKAGDDLKNLIKVYTNIDTFTFYE